MAKTTTWCGCVGFDPDFVSDQSRNYFHTGNWNNGLPQQGDVAIIPNVGESPWITEEFGTHDFDYNITIRSGATFYLNDFALIHSGSTFTIDEGGQLYLHSSGVLTVDGSLVNNGTLHIADKKMFIEGPVKLVIDNGTFTNNNFTFVYEDILVNPNGHLINNARIDVDANPWGDDDYLSEDRITNKGLFTSGQNSVVQIISSYGKFHNEGYIQNNGHIKNNNDFWNKSTGELDNLGMITNEYAFKNTGELNNSGTFTNDGGTFENHINDVFNTGQFTLKNQGQYISTSSTAQFTNRSSGTFTGEQTSWFLNNYGQFTNEGAFNSYSNFENLATFVNSGTLTNHGAMELKKHLPPNVWSRMYNFGTLENKATIIIHDAELINHDYVENIGAAITITSLGNITNEECAVFNNGSTLTNNGTFTNAGFLAQWLGRGIGPVPVQHTASGSQLDRSMPNVSYSGVNKLHVKNVGLSSNHSGLTWSDAMGDLNFAMQMAKCHNITEIWLSKGTYYPDAGSSGFYYQGGLKLYGGFNGNESSKDSRNVMANKTILRNNGSGSILKIVDAPGTSLIDGVHFIDGSASTGGAIHHSNASGNSTITFRRCMFQDNAASSWGGAIYNEGLSSSRSTVSILENCIFYSNTANWGGAININGVGINPTTGANSSKVILRHNTFLDNTAGSGGADIRSYNAGLDAYNNILWSFGSMSVVSGDVEVDHCVVRNGFAGGTSIITQNPLLSDPESGDFSLRINSPAIDSGNGNVGYDIMGVSRPQGNGPDIGAYEYQGALPVEFLNFSANLKDKSVFIDWITGSEVNNDYFEVQRSFDGKNWAAIGMVDGAGNSNETLKYQFIDHHPAPGMNYYRIKQMDFDGQYDYSSIESVSVESLYSIELFPNPTHDYINLHIPNMANVDSQISIYDITGRKLYELKTNAGQQPALQFDLESINIHNPGRYHLLVKTGNHVEKLSFIKI